MFTPFYSKLSDENVHFILRNTMSGCGLIDAAIAREVPRNAKSINEARFISM